MTLQDYSFEPEGAPLSPDPFSEGRQWFLARARPNQYDRARLNLARQGFTCFAPQRPVTLRRGMRMVPATEPLFPGYLFLRIAPDAPWRPVNSTYGVAGLVMRSQNQPQPVPATVMLDLFARTDADGLLHAPQQLAPGDPVRIALGPMASFVARVERLESGDRVGLLLEMMGQAVRVAIPRSHLLPVTG